MQVTSYNSLALSWRLPGQGDGHFQVFALAVIVMALLIGGIMSRVQVPEAAQVAGPAVPERVARFIAERPKAVTPPREVPQTRIPPPPPPPLEREPTVQRETASELQRQPLTEAQRSARERAQNSGLLALQSELAAIANAGELSAMVASGRGQGDKSRVAARAGHDINAITSQTVPRDSISTIGYGSQLPGTGLAEREISGIRSGLFVGDGAGDISVELAASDPDRTAGSTSSDTRRSREAVAIAFDQHKGALYALYARERRRSPDLQGKIVLRITIAANGEVTDVQVLSSELNSPSLESGIVARIKMFRFEAMDAEDLTVVYPIEFLPS